ncbi:MAG: glycosyltransferase [Patescibacteria group bacterium]
MKLLILTQKVDRTDSNLGFFHRWIEEFAKHYEQVTVICLQEGEHSLPANVTVKSLGKEKGTNKFTQILHFAFCVLHSDYQSVFVHMNPEYVVLAGWYWRLMGKCVGLWYTHKHVDLKLRIAEKFANVIFTASPESFRLRSNKVIVTGHGIDTDHFSPSPQMQGNRVVSAGRISKSKHIEEMIATAAPERLLVAGAPITDEDKRYLDTLSGKADFVGSIKYAEMPNFYRSAKLFLNASTTGSLDKAVLEALACAVPVRTSNEAFHDLPSGNLRQWVIDNHSLVRLIPKIVEALKY